jgi:hypothetical protein
MDEIGCVDSLLRSRAPARALRRIALKDMNYLCRVSVRGTHLDVSRRWSLQLFGSGAN